MAYVDGQAQLKVLSSGNGEAMADMPAVHDFQRAWNDIIREFLADDQ